MSGFFGGWQPPQWWGGLAERFSQITLVILLLALPMGLLVATEKVRYESYNQSYDTSGARLVARAGPISAEDGRRHGPREQRTAGDSYRSGVILLQGVEDGFFAINSESFWRKRRKKRRARAAPRPQTGAASQAATRGPRKAPVQNAARTLGSVPRSGLLTTRQPATFFSPIPGTVSRPPIDGGRANKSEEPSYGDGGYRTVCVRLCDGFFWPVSQSADEKDLAGDEYTCRASCAAPARLFYYPNSEIDPVDMFDLRGRPYSRLINAWRYQREYVASCRCRPNPWEEAERARHRKYAELKKKKKLKRYLARLDRKVRRAKRRYARLIAKRLRKVRRKRRFARARKSRARTQLQVVRRGYYGLSSGASNSAPRMVVEQGQAGLFVMGGRVIRPGEKALRRPGARRPERRRPATRTIRRGWRRDWTPMRLTATPRARVRQRTMRRTYRRRSSYHRSRGWRRQLFNAVSDR